MSDLIPTAYRPKTTREQRDELLDCVRNILHGNLYRRLVDVIMDIDHAEAEMERLQVCMRSTKKGDR